MSKQENQAFWLFTSRISSWPGSAVLAAHLLVALRGLAAVRRLRGHLGQHGERASVTRTPFHTYTKKSTSNTVEYESTANFGNQICPANMVMLYLYLLTE